MTQVIKKSFCTTIAYLPCTVDIMVAGVLAIMTTAAMVFAYSSWNILATKYSLSVMVCFNGNISVDFFFYFIIPKTEFTSYLNALRNVNKTTIKQDANKNHARIDCICYFVMFSHIQTFQSLYNKFSCMLLWHEGKMGCHWWFRSDLSLVYWPLSYFVGIVLYETMFKRDPTLLRTAPRGDLQTIK